MSWNYRVMKRKIANEECYGIYEVYYDSDGEPVACSENPVEPFGGTIDELSKDLSYHTAALGKPPLNYEDIAVNVEKGR